MPSSWAISNILATSTIMRPLLSAPKYTVAPTAAAPMFQASLIVPNMIWSYWLG